MGTTEQKELKILYHTEASRYIANAKETLKKAGKVGKYYKDEKYVKTACGTAYNAVLKALDGYLILKEIPKQKGRKSIDYYQSNIAKLDKKLLTELHSAYNVLHLSGYYDGELNISVIQAGLETAQDIIKRIEP